MLITVEARRYGEDYFQAWKPIYDAKIEYIGRYFTFGLMMNGIREWWMENHAQDELIINYQDIHKWEKKESDLYKWDWQDYSDIEKERF